MTDELYSLFQNGLAPFALSITREQAEQFQDYMNLLLEWNQKINLTAITEEKEIIVKHFVDSLTVSPFLREQEGHSLADVGTGAGFPGIPLAIIRPDLSITLVDSLNKRILFLETVCHQLGLQSVRPVHGRAEDVGVDPKYREQFDWVTARAVAPMPVLLEYCLPLVRPGGRFLAMKGGKKEEDGSRAADVLGGKLSSVEVFLLRSPDESYERQIFCFDKIRQTSPKYPRKAGTASRKPL